VTTEEELEGFHIVKSILREVVDVTLLEYKDTKSYFGINLEGKPSKTICRLWLKPDKKFVGILDPDGKEARKPISNLNEIYGLAEILKDRVKYLTQNNPKQPKTIES
jgi:hypothetical protein